MIGTVGVFPPITVENTTVRRVSVPDNARYEMYVHGSVVVHVQQSMRHPVFARRVDPSALAFSFASHRHSSISLLFSSRFIDS